MYNDSIKVANKIITYNDLSEIFLKMNEKLEELKKIYKTEELKNRILETRYQKWTYKDMGSYLTFLVDFYDDTSIKFDNYDSFIGVFNNRVHEIKSMYIIFHLGYSTSEPEFPSNYSTQSISISVTENKLDINLSIDSKDNKLDDVYQFIKEKIQKAHPKYDFVISKKNSINNTVGFALGFIPANIILILLYILFQEVRIFFNSLFILYPICSLILSYLIGNIIANNMLDDLYKNIVPSKVYMGFDYDAGRGIYKDNITEYTKYGEILIGRNINNLKCRREIRRKYKNYKKYILPEIAIIIILTILIAVF